MERVISQTHPAVGRTVTDSTLKTLRNKIEGELPTEASVLTFAKLVYPLVDTVQGGHIGLYPRGALWRHTYRSSRHSLPLSLKQLDNGKVVISALKTGQDSLLLGAEVLEVNNQPISEAIAEANLFSGGSDGPNRSGARNRAVTKTPQHLRWTLGKQDSFRVLMRIAGRNSMVTLLAPAADMKAKDASKAASRKRTKNRERTINYGFDGSRKVAVIDVNSFSGYDPFNVIYPMALKGVLAKAERDSAETIILDLRENGGGRSSNVLRVLRYFISEETEVYKAWTFPKTGWKNASLTNKLIFGPATLFGKGDDRRFGRLMRHKTSPRKSGFAGRLIVLIDSGTFSAATITASVLKSSGRAVLIGQEAGGNYHETYAGLFSMVRLRRTELQLRMPHLLIPIVVDPAKQPFSKTLQPDVVIPITIDDVLDPRDRVLLQALEFVKQ